MSELLTNFLSSGGFIPHGHCYLWKPSLVWLNILSDSLITLAYYCIPFLLVYIVRKRGDIPFDWIFILFGSFIIACGTGHLIDIWTLWHPIYWVAGTIKALTALISVGTGIGLIMLIPQILRLPSPAQLEEANRKLAAEVKERQAAEEALLASQARLAGILDIAEDAIISIDEFQQIQLFNQGAEKIFCYQASEVLGQPLDLLLPLGHAGQHSQHVARFSQATTQSRSMGTRRAIAGRRRDGTEFPAEASISRLELKDGTIYTTILRDISDRQRVENALRQSELRFRTIFEEAGIGIVLTDFEGVIVEANPALQAMLGYSSDELRQMRFTDYTHPDDIATDISLFQNLIGEVCRNYQIEKRYIRADGQLLWVRLTASLIRNSDNQPLYSIATIENITERKHAEESLRASEAELRALFASMTDTIVAFDVQGRYLKIAPTNPSNSYKPCDRLINKTLYEVLPIELANLLLSHIQRAIALQETVSVEYSLPLNNIQVWFSASIAPMSEDTVLFVARDITQRRQAEEALRQSETQLREQAAQLEATLQELQSMQAQLIQTEKMSSLGQMVAGVAHEINNPVNFIAGNLVHSHSYVQDLLELLRLYQVSYPTPTSEIQSQLEAIDLDFLMEDLPRLQTSMKSGCDRIRQIVLSLRNFSRLDEAEVKQVNIHEGLDSTLLILQHRLNVASKAFSIEVIKDYDNLPLVECYAGQLNQVFMNILANAIDALEESFESNFNSQKSTQDKPTIWIRTEWLEERSPTGQVAIRIADNGLGMTSEVSKRLFDPFFTTKPVGTGTGLGLSISYKIVVEKHGGTIECYSEPGRGAEFTIQIPICQLHPRLTKV